MKKPHDDARTFETSIGIDAPRDAVFDAITNDHTLRQWFAPTASIDARVGGEVVWQWGNHHRWAQKIEILEPGSRLRTRYDSLVDDGAGGKRPLYIDFLLEGEGGMTTLRLVQSGFGAEAAFDSEYDGIRRGWPVELRSLRLYLERHRGSERQVVWSTKDLTLGAGEAWRRLVSDRGFGCGTAVESMREGAPFELRTADGDIVRGEALCCHERQFSAVAGSHGDAFFRIAAEEWGGCTHVWLWLGAYDQDAAGLAGLQSRWDAMLGRLFVTGGETAAAGGASA